MKCNKCGSELKSDSKFCENCGAKVKNKLSKRQKILIIVAVVVTVLLMLIGVVFDVIIDNTISEYDYEFLESDLKTVAYSYEHSYIIKEEEDDTYEVIMDYSKDNFIMVSDLKKFLEKENSDNYSIDKKSKKLLSSCDGYIKVYENQDFKGYSKYTSYIKCGDEYTTKGYDDSITKTVLNVNKKKIEQEINPRFTGEYYITKKDKKLELKQKYTTSTYNVGDKIEDAEIIGIYKCDGESCYIVNDSDDKYDTVLVSDNKKVVVYNYKTNEKIKTKIEYKGYSNEILKVGKDNLVIGLIANNLYDEKVFYYSLSDKKIIVNLGKNEIKNNNKLYSSEAYTKLGYIIRCNHITKTKKISNSNKVSIVDYEYYSLIDINSGKEINDSKLESGKYTEINGVPVIYDNGNYNIFGDDFKPIFKNTYMYFYDSDSKVYAYSYKGYGIYDKNSKQVTEIDKNIIGQYGKYFITSSNNVVSVYNADNNSVIKSINFVAPDNLQIQTEILVNEENIDVEGMNFNGTYLFLMKEYMKCDVYKINEINNTVDLVNQNIGYCGY